MQEQDVTGTLNGAARRLIKNATRIAMSDFSAVPALMNILRLQGKSAEVRSARQREGLRVPPFMIASIARSCNLRCKGCYDRAKLHGQDAAPRDELDASVWKRVFGEAAELGVSFILLAGGEPLMRADVVRECERRPDIIFPVFTNGLLVDDGWIDFFRAARNVIPVVSIEGNRAQTDGRRGEGVYDALVARLSLMRERSILFGCSVTLTSENFETVLDDGYVAWLLSLGAKAVFFVEYVPLAEGTESLMLGETQKAGLVSRLDAIRHNHAALFFAFPGDEEKLGGCLASGRGFVHINASGDVESCPFAPYSDSSLASKSLKEALASPTLAVVRKLQGSLAHAGGCALFENRDKVRELLAAERSV